MLRKNLLLVLFSFLSYFAIAQTYFGVDYAPSLSITNQFCANLVLESKTILTLNQSSGLMVGRKLKKKNLWIESGLRTTSNTIAIKFNDKSLAIDEENFPKDKIEKFLTFQIPLTLKWKIDFSNITKKKEDKKEEDKKWSYISSLGISYIFVGNYSDVITGELSSFERVYDYNLNGKSYKRLYKLLGGSNGVLSTFALNYGLSANYKFKKKSSINFSIEHTSGFKTVVGTLVNVFTNDNIRTTTSIVSLTSNASNLSARLGYFYNF